MFTCDDSEAARTPRPARPGRYFQPLRGLSNNQNSYRAGRPLLYRYYIFERGRAVPLSPSYLARRPPPPSTRPRNNVPVAPRSNYATGDIKNAAGTVRGCSGRFAYRRENPFSFLALCCAVKARGGCITRTHSGRMRGHRHALRENAS